MPDMSGVVSGAEQGAALGSVIPGVGTAIGAIGGGILGMFGSRKAAAAADPFASQRGQYQQRLSRLYSDPNYIYSDPSYQFRFGQGMEALKRGEAKGGFFGSGNMGYDLINYGQNLASTEFAAEEDRLARLSGAYSGSPAAAGSFIGQGYDDLITGISRGANSLYDAFRSPDQPPPGTINYGQDDFQSSIPSIAQDWSPIFRSANG